MANKRLNLLIPQIDSTQPNGEIIRDNLTRIKNHLDNYMIDREQVSSLIYSTENLLTQYNIVVSGTNWTTIRAIAVPYKVKDSSDNIIWRMKFNIAGTLSVAAASLTLSIAEVVFKNITGFKQAVTVFWDAGTYEQGYADPNTGNLILTAGANDANPYISGDVELNEAPKFI